MSVPAAGIALIQQLRRKRNGLSIIKVKPEKDKVTRLHNASVAIEAGRVFLPEKEVSWMGEFKKEFLAFLRWFMMTRLIRFRSF